VVESVEVVGAGVVEVELKELEALFVFILTVILFSQSF